MHIDVALEPMFPPTPRATQCPSDLGTESCPVDPKKDDTSMVFGLSRDLK